MDLRFAAYFVGNRPQVTWAWDLSDRNLSFLRGIDAGYFEHVAVTEGGLIDSDGSQYAAAALRVAYGQGLETLMALASAAMQAPRCVIGWMLAYRNEDLRTVVEAATRGGVPIERDPSVSNPSFASLAQSVLGSCQWEPEKRNRLAVHFGRLWSRWGAEFLDQRATSEYNSFKHGMRASLGGLHLAIGVEDTYGVAARPEAMVSLGGSEFGSTFFCAEDIHTRLHQYPRRTSRNWSPLAMAHALHLLAMSIENVVSYLRIIGGDDPSECRFTTPSAEESFELPWQDSSGITFTNMDLVVRSDQINAFTKNEVLAILKSAKTANVGQPEGEPAG